MKDYIILRVVIRLLMPFIFLYGAYIQFHGEVSPGGGFQAGVIIAAGFIVYAFVHGVEACLKLLPLSWVQILAAVGILTYGGTGVVSVLWGGNYLDYSVLWFDPVTGQQLGIFLVELGVGFTVFSVMMIIFYMFGNAGER